MWQFANLEPNVAAIDPTAVAHMEANVRIGIIGDYDAAFAPHAATEEAIVHAATATGIAASVEWLPTESLKHDTPRSLRVFEGLFCAPGSPCQSLEGAINAIRFARETGRPFLGTCGGFQHVVIEYARNVLGVYEAAHAEYDPLHSSLFITPLSCSLKGKEFRVELVEGSRAKAVYGCDDIKEFYYCSFGLNPQCRDELAAAGLKTSGIDHFGESRILELPNSEHRYFVATLFLPQLHSATDHPHPLIKAFLLEAAGFAEIGRTGRWRPIRENR